MDGSTGNDLVQVNGGLTGAAINDSFTIGANGTRVAFARISTGPFTLDIGTTETLIVNGIAGTDTFAVNNLAGVADLTALNLNGLADNDTFNVIPAPTVRINVAGGTQSGPPRRHIERHHDGDYQPIADVHRHADGRGGEATRSTTVRP